MLNILVPGTLLTLISVVYLFGVAPDMTWMGLAGDSPDYVTSSMLFEKAGLGGYPLFITIGWIFQQVFHYGFGLNPYWVLGLVSAISTVIACGFIYATVRLFSTESRLPACLGMLAFAGSLLVWSQSVIPEVYTMTAMFMVAGVYYFIKAYKQERPRLLFVSSIVFGFSLGTHPLVMFAILPCLFYLFKVPLENKPNPFLVIGVGLVGLVGWTQWVIGTENAFYPGLGNDRMVFLLGSAGMIGNLTVYPTQFLQYRLVDSFSVIGLSICILGPFYILGIRSGYKEDKTLVQLLIILSIIPAVFYFTSRPPQWITYAVPSVAFLSILGGVCATYYLNKYSFKPSLVIASVCGLGLLGLNIYSYDIGRSVDPTPTTMRQAYSQFNSFPPDSILYTHTWGHIDVLINSYHRLEKGKPGYNNLVHVHELRHTFRQPNMQNSTVVVPSYSLGFVEINQIDSPTLEKFTKFFEDDINLITEMNPGREVYVAYLKDRSTVQFDFIPASDYNHRLNDVPQLTETPSGRVRVQ